MKNGKQIIKLVLGTVIVFAASLLAFAILWMVHNWQHLSMEELVFELNASLAGTGKEIMASFYLRCLAPAAAAAGLFAVPAVFQYRSPGKRRGYYLRGVLACSVAALVVMFLYAANRLQLFHYVMNRSAVSEYIEKEYADPKKTALTFPEHKKNLVYILAESTETTFADKASGGAFDENVIPELTALALQNECFNGGSGILNGGYALTGTTFTTGAMTAVTSGLPLLSRVEDFSDISMLGDILADAGYRNEFLIGSNATFGSRRTLMKQHGDFEIDDYLKAIEKDRLSKDYFVWWGFEDAKLFEYAKEDLTRLASEDAPFFLLLLTVDTHFEDGYVCQLCREDFGDNQYANVFACSSRQVDDFVRWLEEQDFYEDTAVVISGDHPTMDADFCEGVDPSYDRRVLESFINAQCENRSSGYRLYSTFDFFPTILSALGVKIEGERLGLGTNLFSGEPTLVERDGVDFLNEELSKSASFMENLVTDLYMDTLPSPFDFVLLDIDIEGKSRLTGKTRFEVLHYETLNDTVAKVYVQYKSLDGKVRKTDVRENEDGRYFDIKLSKIDAENATLQFFSVDREGRPHFINEVGGSLYIKEHSSLPAYVDRLLEEDDISVFIAVKDDASGGMTEEMQEALYKLGLRESLMDQFRSSYIAVIEHGEVIAEQVGKEELYFGSETASGTSYLVVSKGFECGNDSSIYVDEVEYSVNMRGLNFVVIDNRDGRMLDATCFDTDA